MTKLGFGQDLLTEQTKTTAIVYDRLGAAFDNARASLGNYLAELAKVPAQQATTVFQNIADNIPQTLTIDQRKQETQGNFLAQAEDVASFNAQVERANTIINQTSAAVGIFGGYFDSLSESTFNAAKAALDFGTNQQKVVETLSAIAPLNDQFSVALQDQVTLMGVSEEEANKLQAALLNLAFSSDSGRQQFILLVNAFLEGKIGLEELKTALDNINASNVVLSQIAQGSALALQREGERTLELADATNQATEAEKTSIEAIAESITKRAESNAEAEKTKAIQEELDRLARQVADGQITLQQAVQLLGEKFKLTSDDAALFAQALGLIADSASATTGRLVDLNQQAGAAIDLFNRLTPNGKAASRAKLKPGAFGEGYIPGTANPLADTETKTGGARLSAQDKLNNQLATNQDKYQDKVEKAYLDHQQRLLDIQREYAAKQLAAQQAAELSKRQSKASFYEKLIDTSGIDQNTFSAEYEAAFAESQRIAQQGNKQLAQDYLKLRQSQIEADIDYANKRKQIEESDLSKSEKANKLQALENVNQLRKDADQEELKQLLENGDAANNALQSQLDEEAQKYQDQLADIGLTSSQLADVRIANWERANKAIAGSPPAELLSFNAPQIVAAGTEVTPQVTQQQTTIQDVVTVKDTDLINSVTGLGDRLSGKLDEVRSAINDAQSAISQKVGAVENAVRNLRPKLVSA